MYLPVYYYVGFSRRAFMRNKLAVLAILASTGNIPRNTDEY